MESPEKDGKVDYIVHESALARLERMNKRLFTFCVIMFIALVASNICWMAYEHLYEDDVTVTQEITTAESPAYVNGTGRMSVYCYGSGSGQQQ